MTTNTEALAAQLQSAVKTYPQMSEDEPGGYCTAEDQLMDEAAAELRRLLAERDALLAERDTLQVGIELMQDNAARYCWLRDNEDGDYGICVWDSEDGWARDARSPSVVDAAIDADRAAMKGTQ